MKIDDVQKFLKALQHFSNQLIILGLCLLALVVLGFCVAVMTGVSFGN